MISEEDKNRVRAATDLVELVQETVPLKPRGQDLWGCCPFHGEKTPSFHVIPATQVWHCFGCGKGGDCFTYVMERENLSFPESIRYLADRAGIEINDDYDGSRSGSRRSRLMDVCGETAAFYHTQLMRGHNGRARAYFASRGMGSAVCRRYQLGFAPGHGALVRYLSSKGFTEQEMLDANVAVSRGSGLADRFFDRVMFPIFDERGRCIAFGGRVMDDGQPKYLNTAETPLFHKKRNLYGFNWAKQHIVAEDRAVVVEGYTDAIACYEAGIGNVVATLGTALTEQHVKTLTRFSKQIVYLFDGDAAGQKAAERAIQFIEQSSVDLRCVVLPDDMDPMEFITAKGGNALRELLDAAEPLMDFVFRKLAERSDVTTPAARTKALDEACRLIYPLRASYLIDSYYVQIADRLGLDTETVRTAAQGVFRTVRSEEAAARRREQAYESTQGARLGRETSYALGGATRAEASAAVRGMGSSPAQAGAVNTQTVEAGASARAAEAPYDAVPLEAYGDVAGSVPAADGYASGGAGAATAASGSAGNADPPVVLTDLERRALAGERELLTLLTTSPDAFRPFAERITAIDWVDSRHETIAWAVLATPEGTAPADVMNAVLAVCPEASELVSRGRISSTSNHSVETNIEFLLDTLELYTVQRRLRAVQAELRQGHALTHDERRDLTIKATQYAARQRALQHAVGGIAEPFHADA